MIYAGEQIAKAVQGLIEKPKDGDERYVKGWIDALRTVHDWLRTEVIRITAQTTPHLEQHAQNVQPVNAQRADAQRASVQRTP